MQSNTRSYHRFEITSDEFFLANYFYTLQIKMYEIYWIIGFIFSENKSSMTNDEINQFKKCFSCKEIIELVTNLIKENYPIEKNIFSFVLEHYPQNIPEYVDDLLNEIHKTYFKNKLNQKNQNLLQEFNSDLNEEISLFFSNHNFYDIIHSDMNNLFSYNYENICANSNLYHYLKHRMNHFVNKTVTKILSKMTDQNIAISIGPGGINISHAIPAFIRNDVDFWNVVFIDDGNSFFGTPDEKYCNFLPNKGGNIIHFKMTIYEYGNLIENDLNHIINTILNNNKKVIIINSISQNNATSEELIQFTHNFTKKYSEINNGNNNFYAFYPLINNLAYTNKKGKINLQGTELSPAIDNIVLTPHE